MELIIFLENITILDVLFGTNIIVLCILYNISFNSIIFCYTRSMLILNITHIVTLPTL